jgi:UDP-glucose 6-dehydrogenase
VEINQQSVERVNAGHAPVKETDLEETIAANNEHIHATLSHQEAIIN